MEIQTGDAFVNLTTMCAPYGKRVNDFLSLPKTVSFLTSLAKSLKVMPDNLVSLQKGNFADGTMQGTWAHRRIAIKCAAWLDSDFEVWLFGVIEKIVSGELVVVPVAPAPPRVPTNYLEAVVATRDTTAALLEQLNLNIEGQTRLEAHRRKTIQLNNELKEAKPKAELYDQFLNLPPGFRSATATAVMCNMGLPEMYGLLKRGGFFMKRGSHNLPLKPHRGDMFCIVFREPFEDPITKVLHKKAGICLLSERYRQKEIFI